MATATAIAAPSQFCTVFLDTSKMPPTPNGAIGGRITYKVFADESAKGKLNPEILSVPLVPGYNFGIARDQVDLLKKIPRSIAHLKKGVLTIIEPDGVGDQPETGYSVDYSEVQAIDLATRAEDLTWLQESQASERRKPVRDALAAQIALLEEEMDTLRSQSEG